MWLVSQLPLDLPFQMQQLFKVCFLSESAVLSLFSISRDQFPDTPREFELGFENFWHWGYTTDNSLNKWGAKELSLWSLCHRVWHSIARVVLIGDSQVYGLRFLCIRRYLCPQTIFWSYLHWVSLHGIFLCNVKYLCLWCDLIYSWQMCKGRTEAWNQTWIWGNCMDIGVILVICACLKIYLLQQQKKPFWCIMNKELEYMLRFWCVATWTCKGSAHMLWSSSLVGDSEF